MKREIKFRAWDKVKKEMGSVAEIGFEELDIRIRLKDLVMETYVVSRTNDNCELMQFTGLKDKNGKEIYEGDILKDDQGGLLEVKFGTLPLGKSGDCVCTYEAWYGKCYGKLGQAPYNECEEIRDWMEIIGNIYENPDLLTPTS